jgi:hypothetical protein
MSRHAVELPNIEDATLRACLAPLAEAIAAGAETVPPFTREPVRPPPDQQPVPAASTGTPPPRMAARGFARTPETLAEWQSLAAQEFAAFGTVQQLLARTDAELVTAALEFPQQLRGTLAWMATMEDRLALQRHAVTTLMERLRMAMTRAAVEAGSALPFTDRATHRSNPGR